MSVITEAAPVSEIVKDQLRTALDRADETIRQGRRAVIRAQRTVEDGASATALFVRRRPLSSVGVALAAGAVLGCVIGFATARARGCRDSC